MRIGRGTGPQEAREPKEDPVKAVKPSPLDLPSYSGEPVNLGKFKENMSSLEEVRNELPKDLFICFQTAKNKGTMYFFVSQGGHRFELTKAAAALLRRAGLM